MAGLKPNEEIMTSAAVLAVVYGVFQMQAPNLADVRAAQPHNSLVHGTVRGAVAESAAVVAAISLLAKSPTIFVVGGLATAVLGWHYYHANAYHPGFGKVSVPGDQSGTMQ